QRLFSMSCGIFSLIKKLDKYTLEEAIKIIQSEKPALAIVDLNLANEDGLEIVSRSKSLGSDTKFLILTSSIRKEDYIRAKDIDVDGYILKEAFAEDILYAIHVIMRGKKFIDLEVLEYESQSRTLNGYLDKLTPREVDVLIELGEGLSNYEIAKKLYISENTVKKHVSNILSKLDLSHRTQAALLINNNSSSICG
ncbi:MAG: response regulator transcription factor, partial [Tissierellia bacterium]|nr:response regulator transcription factor [Tissierellia bacterium]